MRAGPLKGPMRSTRLGNDPMNTLESFRLEGRRAFVTGAGRGIGKCCALGLAEAGADVAVVDVDPAAAASTAAEIRDRGCRSLVCPIDVTSSEAVDGMVAEIV